MQLLSNWCFQNFPGLLLRRYLCHFILFSYTNKLSLVPNIHMYNNLKVKNCLRFWTNWMLCMQWINQECTTPRAWFHFLYDSFITNAKRRWPFTNLIFSQASLYAKHVEQSCCGVGVWLLHTTLYFNNCKNVVCVATCVCSTALISVWHWKLLPRTLLKSKLISILHVFCYV